MTKANPQQADLAYVAGNFDGEGSIATYINYGQTHFRVCITSTYKPTLDWFVELFGGSVNVGSTGNKLGRKTCYNWACTGHSGYAFLVAIEPYLREKREHVQFAINMWEKRADKEAYAAMCIERKQRWGRAAAETK
jgi:hypothetical protein